MKLTLQLVRDGDALFEIPVSPADWPRERLEDESEAFETDFQRFWLPCPMRLDSG
jgi:hypothetical protein